MPGFLDDFISPPPQFYSQEQFEDPSYQAKIKSWFDRVSKRMNEVSFLPPSGAIATDGKPVNFDAIWVAYVSKAAANTEDTVAHALGRTPVDVWVGTPDKSAVIYRGTTTWTSTNIYLKASAATVTVNVLVF